jgi:LmbE family N-acetylglucosaminyl deacetylase
VKIRIYFEPGWILGLLAITAATFWTAFSLSGTWVRWLWVGPALFYSALTLVSLWARYRCSLLEEWISWDTPERLLIVVPHQDDCVICAGGIGIRNQAVGGETHVVYAVQDDAPDMADRRRAEAVAAWSLAGVAPQNLRHLDLLPSLYEHAPGRLRCAADELGRTIDAIEPTAIVMPLFEGGHVHHDLLNHIVSTIAGQGLSRRIFESPEYSPFVSLNWTPHRVVSLCGRWLFGLVAYYGPPDGIDSRPIMKVRLAAHELDVKRKMLAGFRSQNGDSLAVTRCYPDRLIRWRPRPYRARPFEVGGTYLELVQTLRRWFPSPWVRCLFPAQIGTVGREPEVTDLDKELSVG